MPSIHTSPAPTPAQGQAVGSPPGSDGSTSGSDTVPQEQFVEVRRKVTEQAEQIGGYKDILSVMAQNPERNFSEVKHFIDTSQWPSATATPEEAYSEMLGGFKEEIREPLAQVLQQVEQRTREQVMNEMQPVMQQTQAMRQGAEYSAGYSDGGLDPSLVGSPLVTEIEQELGAETWFRDLKSRHPRAAAKIVAEKVQTIDGYAAQRQAITGARNSSMAMGGRSGALAGRGASAAKLPRTSSMRDILAAHQSGASDIVFND